MKPRTHKSSINLVGAIILVLAVSLLWGISEASANDPTTGEGYAKHEAACYIFAVGSGLSSRVANVHASRVKLNLEDEGNVAYALGYHTGSLDVYGVANTTHYGSYEASRTAAAEQLYKAFNCTVLEAV